MTKTTPENNEPRLAKVQGYRGVRPGGTKNFTKAEISSLILEMKVITPLGPGEWERLSQRHAKKWPGRDSASIRRKCKRLLNKARSEKILNCSWEILLLKKIHKDIRLKYMHGGASEINNEEEIPTPSGAGQEERRPNYSQDEIRDFLSVAEGLLPVTLENWELVAQIHAQKWPGRDAESLHNKFYEFANWPTPPRRSSNETLLSSRNSAADFGEDDNGEKQVRMDEGNNEIDDLLRTIYHILPLEKEEWQLVAQKHCKDWPDRDVASVRRKFHALKKKQRGKPSSTSWEIGFTKKIIRALLYKRFHGGVPQVETSVVVDTSQVEVEEEKNEDECDSCFSVSRLF